MKNFDTVQLVILIIAIIAGYHLLIELPQLLWLIYRWADEGMNFSGHFTNVVTSVIYILINLAAVIILINKSSQLARYIIQKSDYEGELKISQSKDDLLSVVFITMGVYILVTRLPNLMINLYDYFKERHGMASFENNYIITADRLPVQVIEVILAIIIIVYSKQFTDYFSKEITHAENTENIASSEK